MRKNICLILIVFGYSIAYAQNWTHSQLTKANTAGEIEYLTKVEKECILYINLCRLYPKDFIKYEVLNYFGTEKYGDYLKNSQYRKSLIEYLQTLKSKEALYFDIELFKNASCFAEEQGIAGTTGHDRINCIKGNYAECCSYGMDTGKDIVMQLLIDHDVPSLGHRLICLSDSYSKIGVSIKPHIEWGTCAVINFIW